MTFFEVLYSVLRRFDHPLYQQVHQELVDLVPSETGVRLLDVGGRRSNYTVGLDAQIWITELPRTTDTQKSLDLGATDATIAAVMNRRSNIVDYVFDDLTRTRLEPGRFDVAVAAEVIEHVPDDEAFVRNLHRVLRNGGTAVLTTPNGDFVPNTNPDHQRHYRREELEALLRRYFAKVDVGYSVLDSPMFAKGLHRWTLRHPLETLVSFYGNWNAYRESSAPGIKGQAMGTLHLFAVVSKAG